MVKERYSMADMAYRFPIGAQIRCRQTGLRFSIVGVPKHCFYLPTNLPVYLCSEDTLDCHVLAIPQEQVERDMELDKPHPLLGGAPTPHPMLQKPIPGVERRVRDRRVGPCSAHGLEGDD